MKPTKQQKLIYKMLTENTGIHFLDSGFSNGRMWQRNQKKTIQDSNIILPDKLNIVNYNIAN